MADSCLEKTKRKRELIIQIRVVKKTKTEVGGGGHKVPMAVIVMSNVRVRRKPLVPSMLQKKVIILKK